MHIILVIDMYLRSVLICLNLKTIKLFINQKKKYTRPVSFKDDTVHRQVECRELLR